MPRVIASIEARMSSSRLPGKMMLDICGKPVVQRVTERVMNSALIDDVVLATTTNAADDVLANWAEDNDVPFYRGSEDDVLLRVVEAQRFMKSEIVVEICGDTPFVDSGLIDLAIRSFLANDCDVVSNTNKLSFPQGIDAQVFSLEALEAVEKTVSDPAVREHVSLYFYEHPELYRIVHLLAPAKWERPEQRLQLDYEEDLLLAREIYNALEPGLGSFFGLDEVINLLESNPVIAGINAACEEKPVR